MVITDEIGKHPQDFITLCQEHNVKSLYAFGSAVSNRFNYETSDIDLLVEIDASDPMERGEKLLSLWDKFELFFHRKVDLLTNASIHNDFLRKSIDTSKILIYDGSGQKVLN